MNTSIRIDILNPKVLKLLKNLADLNLISIEEDSQKGLDFTGILEKLRSDASSAPGIEEITSEVEKVRAKRYGKQAC